MFSARSPKRKDDTLKVLKEVQRDDVATIIRPHKEVSPPAGIEDVFNELEVTSGRRKESPAKSSFRSTSDMPARDDAPQVTAVPEGHKAHFRDPWAIWTLSDLFARCGPFVTVFVVAQIAAAVFLAQGLVRVLDQDRAFLTGVLLLAVFVADGVTFTVYRGRLLAGYRRPVTWLALSTIAPGLVCRAVSWWNSIHLQGLEHIP